MGQVVFSMTVFCHNVSTLVHTIKNTDSVNFARDLAKKASDFICDEKNSTEILMVWEFGIGFLFRVTKQEQRHLSSLHL